MSKKVFRLGYCYARVFWNLPLYQQATLFWTNVQLLWIGNLNCKKIGNCKCSIYSEIEMGYQVNVRHWDKSSLFYLKSSQVMTDRYLLDINEMSLNSRTVVKLSPWHSLIREVLIQSCSAGAKNFTNYVFCHPQCSGVIQNIEKCCAKRAKF